MSFFVGKIAFTPQFGSLHFPPLSVEITEIYSHRIVWQKFRESTAITEEITEDRFRYLRLFRQTDFFAKRVALI